jgi:hypothetical protein
LTIVIGQLSLVFICPFDFLACVHSLGTPYGNAKWE